MRGVIARSGATKQSRWAEPLLARNCFAALAMTGSRRRARLLHKRDLLRRRDSAEDRVAVREAAEALDDLDVGPAVASEAAALGVAIIAITGQALGQSPCAALVGEIFAVVERHVEELAPGRRDRGIEAAGQCPVGGGERRRVGRIGARRGAEDVARDLIEQQ